MKLESQNWITRKAVGTDLPYIYSTFLKSYKHDSSIGKATSNRIFFAEYQNIADLILERSKTIVACLPDDHNVILGYLIFEPNYLHFVFVKEAFRKLGVAKALCMEAVPYLTDLTRCTITHKTYSLMPLLKKYPHIQFNPFVLFNQKEKENV